MIYSYDYNTIDANEFVAMSAVSDSYELTRVYSCELIGASVRAPYCSKSSFSRPSDHSMTPPALRSSAGSRYLSLAGMRRC